MKKALLILVIIGRVLFGLIQLIPVDRKNSPTSLEPNWSTPVPVFSLRNNVSNVIVMKPSFPGIAILRQHPG
jgi:hypothetical protein